VASGRRSDAAQRRAPSGIVAIGSAEHRQRSCAVTVASEQPQAAHLSQYIARRAAGMAVRDEPLIAVAEREG
jgi:hypothetical protein